MSFAAEYVEQIEAQLGDEWMGRIYREQILKMRTRAYEFASLRKAATPEIHHTLLGIELKIGRRRTLCPDLATARYLAVFARLGSQAAAIPYDITKISLVADELERSWHRIPEFKQTTIQREPPPKGTKCAKEFQDRER